MIDDTHSFFIKLQNSGNYLLVKDDIGKSKPSTRDLPHNNFVFGKKTFKDQESAGKLIGFWQEHKKSPSFSQEKNYCKLNMLCLEKKITRAPDQRKFRKKVSLSLNFKKKEKKVPDLRFGLSVRPSTPMRAVIQNFYGELSNKHKHFQYSQQEKTETQGQLLNFLRKKKKVRRMSLV